MAESTQKNYIASLRSWEEFCTTFKKDFFNPSVEDLLHFLEDRRRQGVSYTTLNTIRSAISFISDSKIGDHPTVSRYFKGAFKLNPTKARYNHIWDVSQVLDHLATMSPLEELSLLDLSKKLATLLALISAHRTQTIHSISLKGISSSNVGTWITISKLIKTSRPGSASPKIFLPRFSLRPELCASHVLEAYIERTQKIRGDDQLFLTTTKPHQPASKDTVSRWIVTTLRESGIDTEIFKSHSTRHAAASFANASGINLSTIKATAGWSANSQVFQKFYNIPVVPKEQETFANFILRECKL